ncbi:MAG: helix-turn-helix domain-containing protein [Proteobacteria bacterium]|nr:helix-turn-helix domain-containing protein [Pseudomonadota bacterium]
MSELGDTLRAAREAKGMTQVALAAYFNISKSAVNQWESGKNIPDQRKIAALAEKLELDPALLVRLAGIPASGSTPAAVMSPVPTPPGRPDIPVWASAEAGSDGAMVLVNDPIDWIRRSERMQGVQKPFAFYVIGSSMSPAIEHGDQVVVNPSLLPMVGKDHVFLQTQEDGTILALVKRLLRVGATAWKVRQYNPPRDFELAKSKWSKALMISEKRVG